MLALASRGPVIDVDASGSAQPDLEQHHSEVVHIPDSQPPRVIDADASGPVQHESEQHLLGGATDPDASSSARIGAAEGLSKRQAATRRSRKRYTAARMIKLLEHWEGSISGGKNVWAAERGAGISRSLIGKWKKQKEDLYKRVIQPKKSIKTSKCGPRKSDRVRNPKRQQMATALMAHARRQRDEGRLLTFRDLHAVAVDLDEEASTDNRARMLVNDRAVK